MGKGELQEKIVLCKMFTGNYWENENNLGHESINLFLPDDCKKTTNEENISYMYLPASGDYKLDDHKIKKVLLVRGFSEKGGKTVQILAKADVMEDGGELLRDKNGPLISSCSSGSEFVGLMNIFSVFNNVGAPICLSITDDDVREKISEIAAKYDFAIEKDDDYRRLAIKLGFKKEGKIKWGPNQEMTRLELQNRLKGIREEIPVDESIRRTVQQGKSYRGENLGNYYFWYAVSKGVISDPRKKQSDYTAKEGFCNLVARKYQKAIELYNLFQSCEQKNVRALKYAELEYDTIFKHNAHYGQLNICASLKVQNLKIVPRNKNILLTINEESFNHSKGADNKNEKWLYVDPQNMVEEVDEKNNKGLKKISAQSQKVYLPYNDKIKELWAQLEGLGNEWWEDAGPLKIKKEEIPYLQDSFLTVIKKEYDELTYSNLFAHFFRKSSDFSKYFFKNIQYKRKIDTQKNIGLKNVNLSNNLSTESLLISDEDWMKIGGGTVKREEKNIDIVLKDGEQVIVIENKIKSALNGVEVAANQETEDESDGKKGKKITFKDQLIRYYKYIEDKYSTNSSENHKYFIFAPDYNPIEEEEFGTVNEKNMDEIWNIARYSDIFNCCKVYDYHDDCYFDDFDKILFKEFLKALNVHTDSSANNYYRQMQKRLMRIKADAESKNRC